MKNCRAWLNMWVLAVVSLMMATPAFATVYRPGLIQAKFNTSKDYSSDILTASGAEVVPGTVMADVAADENSAATQGYTNAITGTVYHWNKQNTTFGYKGQIHAAAGTTYTFGKYFDDGTLILVGGRQIMSNDD